VTRYTTSPLNDPNFDLKAWSAKHFTPSEEVAQDWAKTIQTNYGNDGKAKFGCVGYW
jgi:hypothetical protein